ncbi:lysophospholipid acyltransferase family protein [Burkholderiaceae bacterium DAT-1]|nr:lysophospholipid acyltransferase family protein [Burkholderiaceae bacterium DAT-1]
MIFLKALMWLISRLPYPIVSALGAGLGRLIYWLAAERRRVGRVNLRLCFPEKTEAEREALLKQHFGEMARMLLEFGYAWFASAERMRQLVRIEGQANLDKLDGQPVIFLSAHFTGLELAGLRMSIDTPMIDIYTNQKHAELNRFMLERRARFGGQLLSRQEGIRPVIRAVKSGLRLYYFPDQDFGPDESVFVPFFGVQAATISGLSRLAAVTGAHIVPFFWRRDRHGYVISVGEPLQDFPTKDVVADTARINQEIEARVRKDPARYFWLHKRFKTRPEGEDRFY